MIFWSWVGSVISCFYFIKVREVSCVMSCIVSAVQVLLLGEVDAQLHRYYLYNINDVSTGRERGGERGTRVEQAVDVRHDGRDWLLPRRPSYHRPFHSTQHGPSQKRWRPP